MTTNNTNAIDDKKENYDGFKPDFKEFMKNYFVSLLFTITIGIFIIGGIGLYTTKIAQSNILPDNIELAPYTLLDRVVKDIQIDINIVKPSILADNKECFSQKAIFNSKEYLDSFQKSWICMIKQSADPNSGFFSNMTLFLSQVYENIICKNFLAINSIFYYLSFLPESLIMLVYGFFGIFIWLLLFGFNFCISIFYHFINIPQLFRATNNEKWEKNEDISFINPLKWLLFFFLWLPIGSISAFVMPFFFTIYGLFSPLYATYNIKSINKKCNIMDFIKDTFAYKKIFLFILATISLISNGVKYLGTNSLVGIGIAIIFAYIMGLYNDEIPEQGVNGFTMKIRQNVKQASIQEVEMSNPKLVKICDPIKMDDEKMNQLLQQGSFRQLTKSNQTQDVETDEVPVNDINTSESMSSNVTNNPNQLVGGGNKKNKKYHIRLV